MFQSETPKVAVLEYLCGGGLSNSEAPVATLRSLFTEGLGMLVAIASDLAECHIEVTTVLDPSLFDQQEVATSNASVFQRLERVNIVSLKTKDWLSEWRSVASGVDVTLVIAPEIDDELLRIVEHLRSAGCDVHISSSSFITTTSDKSAFSLSLPITVSHPETWLVSDFAEHSNYVTKIEDVPSNASLGWVLKSRDGAGCYGMSWYATVAELRNAIGMRADVRNSPERWIIQPWHAGEHASMAVLCESSTSFSFLGACSQYIHKGDHVTYLGGKGPILHEEYDRLKLFVERLLTGIPGAKGWIGIDFLYPSHPTRSCKIEDFVAVEINPRLTTSYLAYRQWYGPELALGVLGLAADREWNYSALPKSPQDFTVA